MCIPKRPLVTSSIFPAIARCAFSRPPSCPPGWISREHAHRPHRRRTLLHVKHPGAGQHGYEQHPRQERVCLVPRSIHTGRPSSAANIRDALLARDDLLTTLRVLVMSTPIHAVLPAVTVSRRSQRIQVQASPARCRPTGHTSLRRGAPVKNSKLSAAASSGSRSPNRSVLTPDTCSVDSSPLNARAPDVRRHLHHKIRTGPPPRAQTTYATRAQAATRSTERPRRLRRQRRASRGRIGGRCSRIAPRPLIHALVASTRA